MCRTLVRYAIPLAAAVMFYLLCVGEARAYPWYMPPLEFPSAYESVLFPSDDEDNHPGPYTVTVADLENPTPTPATPGIVPPPDPGSDAPFSATSFFDVFVEITLDGIDYTANGQCQTLISTPDNMLPATTVFDTEMLQMDISGGTLPSGTMFRESPTQQSTGQLTATNIGGGLYHIDSFFDVFTELSIDGGDTWIPSTGTMHLTSTPEPSSIFLLGMGGALMWRAVRRRRA